MKTNEQELVELAGVACGIDGEWVEHSLLDSYYKLPTTGIVTYSDGNIHIWNPITSSGDAFRLSTKLGIHWYTNIGCDIVNARCIIDGTAIAEHEPVNQDINQALRLLITRVAAQAGRLKIDRVKYLENTLQQVLLLLTSSTHNERKAARIIERALENKDANY